MLEVRIEECDAEVRKYGTVKEEAGRLDFYLAQIILLFGSLTSPDFYGEARADQVVHACVSMSFSILSKLFSKILEISVGFRRILS